MDLFIYIFILILNLGIVGFICGYANYKIDKERKEAIELERLTSIR